MQLYRGFNAYILAIMFWVSVLPLASNFLMQKLPLFLNPDKIEEVMEEKEIE
jgi:hypothetical protein